MRCFQLSSKINLYLEKVLLLFLTFFLVSFLYIGYEHIVYPFELEWIEGGYLVQCERIANGDPVYISPINSDFIPYIYTPLYFYVVGVLGKVFGVSFAIGRLVSFLSIIGSGLLIFMIIKRETIGIKGAFVGTSLLFSAYSFTGCWYDIVRSDSLFVFLLLLGCYILRFKSDSYFMVILSSVIFVLAFLTKQPGFYFVGFCSLAFIFTEFRKAVVFLFTSAIIAFGALFIINSATSGWFWFYIYKLVEDAVFRYDLFPEIFSANILKGIPFLMILLIIYAIKCWKGIGVFLKSRSVIWFWGFCGGLVSFLSTMLFYGGYSNGLIPLVCFVSILGGMAFNHLQGSGNLRLIAILLLFGQLFLFRFDVGSQLPSRKDYEFGERFISYINGIPSEEVLVYKHSYYPVMTCKKPQIHFGALNDFLVVKDREEPEPFYDKFRNREFGAVILDYRFNENNTRGLDRLILDNYYFKEQIFSDDDEGFYTKVGPRLRPNYVYFPRERSVGLFDDYEEVEKVLPEGVDPAAVLKAPGM